MTYHLIEVGFPCISRVALCEVNWISVVVMANFYQPPSNNNQNGAFNPGMFNNGFNPGFASNGPRPRRPSVRFFGDEVHDYRPEKFDSQGEVVPMHLDADRCECVCFCLPKGSNQCLKLQRSTMMHVRCDWWSDVM